MDYTGASYIGVVTGLCVARQVEHVIREIPDPHKEIGLIKYYVLFFTMARRCGSRFAKTCLKPCGYLPNNRRQGETPRIDASSNSTM
jgi:hypothetical protein